MPINKKDLTILHQLERKVAWLSAWTVHYANNIREKNSSIKVGGHQASSASVISILSALYFTILKPEDRVAVKPHASPAFHAIQYILGLQTKEQLQNFRSIGGAQAYPSRTKDSTRVDFSTGSVGLGGAITLFGSLIQDYVYSHKYLYKKNKLGRMIALFGDAELDEGNVYEALLEGAKQNIRNCWWIIDYNRQSLDAIIPDRLFIRIGDLFELMDWRVITKKYGKKLQSISKKKGGKYILRWIDNCPNDLYGALTFKGGPGWRSHLEKDLNNNESALQLIQSMNDEDLNDLMTNLAGNDIESVIETFDSFKNDDVPTCFIFYTVKGYGLPLAGHKDNHAGLLNEDQMHILRSKMKIKTGKEWDVSSGLNEDKEKINKFLSIVPFLKNEEPLQDIKTIDVPDIDSFDLLTRNKTSTQEAFGRLLNEIGKGNTKLANRIITASPDVTVSTSLGGWVNQRKIYNRKEKEDVFKDEKVISAQSWMTSRSGQHVELGIAENNLFLFLAAAGLSHKLFGTRLLPIGTIYDTFIQRGLDALNYAAYLESKFILVATPSGVSLATEGGAHQSITSPLIGIGQPNVTAVEPAYVDELAVLFKWALEEIQKKDGNSVYFRLSTLPLEQPARELDSGLISDIENGAYWKHYPKENPEVIIIYQGVLAKEVEEAFIIIKEELSNTGVLAITSSDKLYQNWNSSKKLQQDGENVKSHIENMLEIISPHIPIITVIDGHSAALSWLGGVKGNTIFPIGISNFGQSGKVEDIYEKYQLNSNNIIKTIASAILSKKKYKM